MLTKKLCIITLLLCISLGLVSCGTQGGDNSASSDLTTSISSVSDSTDEISDSGNEPVKGARSCIPNCLIPLNDGTKVIGTDTVSIDISHNEDGYICVTYTGDAERTRLMITTPQQVTYTYDLTTGICDAFPLTGGCGSYSVGVYELISGNDYSVLFSDAFDVSNIDEFLPYLYPNQFVKFDKDSDAVSLASELVFESNSDIDAITSVYNYVISNITYDYDKAQNVESTYIPNIDIILQNKKGICFDYASLMAAMLRSQNIPTRLEIGYAGDAYHAWVSTYVKDIGWVNGIIEFNGKDWELMDPTFASNMSEENLKSFIGEGDNYITQYVY